MIQKVLVCSDGSETALRAIKTAAEIAGALKSSIVLLHVFEVAVPPSLMPTESGFAALDFSPPPDNVQDALVARSSGVLRSAGVEFKDRREVAESAEETILEVAEQEEVDLIVLGSRGLSAVQRFLLGSVSDRVAHHARCAVLIVK